MKREKPLPCPFHNKKRVMGVTSLDFGDEPPMMSEQFHVVCACGASGPSRRTASGAIAAWNKAKR